VSDVLRNPSDVKINGRQDMPEPLYEGSGAGPAGPGPGVPEEVRPGAVGGQAKAGRPAEKGRRRGRETSPRQAQLTVRFSAGEAAAVAEAAQRAGLTVTGFTATASLAAARGLPAPRAVVSRQQLAVRAQLVEAMAARTELRRLGTNVNQAVRVANTTGAVPPRLLALAAQVEAAVSAVTDVIADLAGRSGSV